MSVKGYGQASPEIAQYVDELLKPEDAQLAEIKKACDKAGLPTIQLGSFDVRHIEVITRMTGARKVVEIGTLGGYSGVAIARNLPEGGVLHTFEISESNAQTAMQNFVHAKMDHKIKLHVGAALENLEKIERDGPFDIVFIDADKGGYPAYAKWAAKNLRTGGVIVGDNTFGWGKVARAPSAVDGGDNTATLGLREFNKYLADSPEFLTTIFPTEEGLTVGVKF